MVVEGRAERVTGLAALTDLADAYRDKYGDDWDYDADDEVFDPEVESRVRVPGGADEGHRVREVTARADDVQALTARANGFVPTAMSATTVLAAVSITDTVLDPELVTNAR